MNTDALIPSGYTYAEGGIIQDWNRGNHGAVSMITLLDKRDPKTVIINNVKLHALFFPKGEILHYYRWDCLNGWTRKPEGI